PVRGTIIDPEVTPATATAPGAGSPARRAELRIRSRAAEHPGPRRQLGHGQPRAAALDLIDDRLNRCGDHRAGDVHVRLLDQPPVKVDDAPREGPRTGPEADRVGQYHLQQALASHALADLPLLDHDDLVPADQADREQGGALE